MPIAQHHLIPIMNADSARGTSDLVLDRIQDATTPMVLLGLNGLFLANLLIALARMEFLVNPLMYLSQGLLLGGAIGSYRYVHAGSAYYWWTRIYWVLLISMLIQAAMGQGDVSTMLAEVIPFLYVLLWPIRRTPKFGAHWSRHF